MDFPYAKILKQAYVHARTKPFLWGLGLFMIWTQFFGLWLFTNLNASETESAASRQAIDSWVEQSRGIGPVLGLTVLLGTIALFIFYFYSRLGLPKAIKDLMDHKPAPGFWRSITGSRGDIYPAFRLWLMCFAVVFVVAGILSTPVLYLLALDFSIRAILLGILALIILVPTLFLVFYVNVLSVQFLSLNRMTVWDSVRSSFDLISQFWLQLIIVSIILIAINVAAFFAGIFAMFLIFIPVVWLAGNALNLGLLIPVTAVGLALFLILQAGASAYSKTVWTLVFLELSKPKKTVEVDEAAVVPEVIA